MLNWQKKALTKIISLAVIQSFLFTGVIYPESINNKDIAGIYEIKKLRVPMGFSDDRSRADDLSERMLAGLDELAGKNLQYGLKTGYIPEKDEPYFYELIDMFREGGIGESNSERLARSLVKMRDGGLEMICLLGLINEKEKQILLSKDLGKLKTLPAAEKADFVKRFRELTDSYNDSLAGTQREVFMLRLVPVRILKQLADRYNCSRTTVISAIMKHGDFHIWMKSAYGKVNEIKDMVGGSTNAWHIVLSQGIENTDEWVKKAGLKAGELRKTVKGLSGREWFIIIAQGLEGIDAWVEKGRRKVSGIESIVGGASRAWEIVIAQGLDNVDDWLAMAKVKAASIRDKVGNDSMAWTIVTKHTLSEVDAWVKDAEAIVEKIKDVAGGKNNAWFIVSAQGLDDAEAWVTRAKLKADSIKDETGGYTYAWQIIIGQGIEKVDDWMNRARPKINRIRMDFGIDNSTAWQVVIAQGLDGIDTWLGEAKAKVDSVQKIVNARSIAWKIVIAYGIDKSEDWAKKADKKANEIKDKVGGYRNALFVAINYGLDKADTWVKEAELKADEIEKVLGSRSLAWKVLTVHGLDGLDDWMKQAGSKVEDIAKKAAGGRYNAWLIVISQGLENVDSWMKKAQKKVGEIKGIVGSDSNAWMIVIRQNLDNVDSWVQAAEIKVKAIKDIVGGERNAWFVLIRHGVEGTDIWLEEAKIKASEMMSKNPGMPVATAWHKVIDFGMDIEYIASSLESQQGVKDQKIQFIGADQFNWDKVQILPSQLSGQLGKGGINRLNKLNSSLNLLRSPPGKGKEPLFSREELESATQNGFQLYKGDIIGKTSHDNIPGVNIALFYSKNYMRISDYTRAFFMAHEFKHALGGNEQEAYEIMIKFLVRHGLKAAEKIRDDIEREVIGVGSFGKNLVLDLVKAVINELENTQDEQKIIDNVQNVIEPLMDASYELAAVSDDDSQYIGSKRRKANLNSKQDAQRYAVGSVWTPSQEPLTKKKTGMTRRSFLKKTAILGAAAFAGKIAYDSGEPSEEEQEEKLNSLNPIHSQGYGSKVDFEKEKKDFIAARKTSKNTLSKEDAKRAESFATPSRIAAIKLAADSWDLEPELIAAFLYEEKTDKDSKNSIKESIKEFLSRTLGIHDMGNTVGIGNVSVSFMKDREFLDFLYDEGDFVLSLLENKNDITMFNQFMHGSKDVDGPVGYEFIKQISTDNDWKGWIETMYGLLNNVAEIEPVNILLAGYAMRKGANEIRDRNRGVTAIPDAYIMEKNSKTWIVENYKKIPDELKDRYSNVFNSDYYPPYAYQYFLAADYTGVVSSETGRKRALAKVKAYIMFLNSGKFKKGVTSAHFSLSSKNNSRNDSELIASKFIIGEAVYDTDNNDIMDNIKKNTKILETISLEQSGVNVTFAIHGAPGREKLAKYIKENPNLLQAILRSKALQEGELSKEITIVLADKYDYLGGDHKKNNLIILNASDLNTMLERLEKKEIPSLFFDEFLTSILSEELAHERGAGADIDTEEALAQGCARRTMLYLIQQGAGIKEYIEFVNQYGNELAAQPGYADDLRQRYKEEENKIKTAHTLDPAAKLFLTNGQIMSEPRWLKLRVLLQVISKRESSVSIQDIKDESQTSMKAYNAINKDTIIGEEELSALVGDLVSAGLLTLENGRYSVGDKRLSASWSGDWEYIKKDLQDSMGDVNSLKQALLNYEKISKGLWAGYPVEALYPVLQAVSMLDSGAQAVLLERILDIEKSGGADFYGHRIFDAIRLELQSSSDIRKDWLERYAPNLKGRDIVIVAAEISRMAGGLGRVLTYHTIEMMRLAGKDSRFIWVEPYYKDFEEMADTLSTEKAKVLEYEVEIRGKKVKVEAYKRVKVVNIPNEKGDMERIEIDNYLIRDVEKYYVGKLYKYKKEDSWAAIDEFTEFFSKATLEFTNKMAEESEKSGGKQGWQKPLLSVQDGQCLPIAFWRRLLYKEDPVKYKSFEKIPIAGATHTYLNRGIFDFGYSIEEARGFLSNALKIPKEYHWYWLRRGADGKIFVDLTSSGIRTSNMPNGVARMHAFEENMLDPQISLTGITNGDIRILSAKEFNGVLREEFGNQVDIEHPSVEQIVQAKAGAKKKLYNMLDARRKLDAEKGNYHIYGDINIDPGKMIVEYSGRLVYEKFGMGGDMPAFTFENIKKMVKAGAQIVIFGNVQPYEGSIEIGRMLKLLAEEISQDKEQNKENSQYKEGTFVFVDKFDLEQQITLLAAADLQAQISQRGTGASEYTESNATDNFALQLGPPWIEGLIQLQGTMIDRTRPGIGNTIVPHANTEEAYLEAFTWAIELYKNNRLDYAEYQKNSKSISRALEARNTSAAYLTYWSGIVDGAETFDIALEPRSDAMTEAGLRLSGIHIQKLNPELTDSGTVSIGEITADSYLKVEAVLKCAPGVNIPDVIVHTNAASAAKEEVWRDYKLTLDSFDGDKAVFKGEIFADPGREEMELTWKINQTWLGNGQTNAIIRKSASGDKRLASNMKFLFDSAHNRPELVKDKLKDFVKDIDIFLVEIQQEFAPVFNKVSAGDITPMEAIESMRRQIPAGRSFTFESLITLLLDSVYNTGVIVVPETGLDDEISREEWEYGFSLFYSACNYFAEGDLDMAIKDYAKHLLIKKRNYDSRNRLLRDSARELLTMYPDKKIGVYLGAMHTPVFMDLKKEALGKVEREFSKLPVFYNASDVLVRAMQLGSEDLSGYSLDEKKTYCARGILTAILESNLADRDEEAGFDDDLRAVLSRIASRLDLKELQNISLYVGLGHANNINRLVRNYVNYLWVNGKIEKEELDYLKEIEYDREPALKLASNNNMTGDVKRPQVQGREKFYRNIAENAQVYLKDTGLLCKWHSAVIVERLFKEYGIKAVIMEKIFPAGGAHYWVQTEDGFIIDAFTLGYGSDLRRKAGELGGNVDILVIDKNTGNKLEQQIIEQFYSGAAYYYQLTQELYAGTVSAVREVDVMKEFSNSENLDKLRILREAQVSL